MARLGFRTFNQMIGHSDRLEMRRAIAHWKAQGLDYSRLLARPKVGPEVALYNCEGQDHGLAEALDHDLIRQAQPALESGTPVQIQTRVHNYNRTVGAMLSGEVAKRYGHAGLPEDSIHIKAIGTGGQSFGAWVSKGVTIELEGEANDYVGKGLSGGRLIIYPPKDCAIARAEDNIIVGNRSMVELQPVTPEDEVLEALDHKGGDLEGHGLVDLSRDMTRFDAQRLKGLIERHLHYTNSEVARRLLADWERSLPRFVKVMPVDYQRALAEMQANQSRPPRPSKQRPIKVTRENSHGYRQAHRHCRFRPRRARLRPATRPRRPQCRGLRDAGPHRRSAAPCSEPGASPSSSSPST